MSTPVGSQALSHPIAYRPDIDGLRAIAVAAVIVYHFSKSALPGGYLGVDIFFVLSGNLITSIIWREAMQGRFSIARFYERRVRRIMPALLLVLFFTTVAAIALLLPTDLSGYAKSLFSTLGFVANIYGWRDTGYFSRIAEEKPLLHLWSLGVEEQFYILFPLLLVLCAKYVSRATIVVLGIVAGISFASNVYALRIGADSPAFFLLPTRAWELGVGAIVALLPTRFVLRPKAAQVTSVLGVLLMLGGLFVPRPIYTSSPVALTAVVGTALTVYAGCVSTPLLNRALSIRPVVFIGLISFSLYLWHWPITVLSKYYLVRDLKWQEMVVSAIAMVGASVASWYWIERPFRGKRIPIRRVLLAVGGGAAVLGVVAAMLLITRGLPARLDRRAAIISEAVGTNYRCPISDYIPFGASRACVLNLSSRNPLDADVILLGNSHAQMYAPTWKSVITEQSLHGLLVPLNGCLPTVMANLSVECIQSAEQNLKEVLRLPNAKVVVLGLTWWNGGNALVSSDTTSPMGYHRPLFVHALDDLADRLRKAGKQVVLIGPIAEPGWDVASILSRELAFGHTTKHVLELGKPMFDQRFKSIIDHFQDRNDVIFLRPDSVQCDDTRCHFLLEGRSLFADSNHIAVAELFRFREMFEQGLARAMETIPPGSSSPRPGRDFRKEE